MLERPHPSSVPRYTPATPTVSPYVSLFSRNGTAATNYYGLVRPLERQQVINQRQTQLSSYNQGQIQKLRDQEEAFSQPKVKPTGTAGWFQTLDDRYGYQIPSHFYGQWNTGGGPQRRRR